MSGEANLPRFGRDQSFPETSLGAYLPVAPSRRPAGQSRAVSPPASIAMAGALDRLEEIIEQETATMEARLPADLPDLNRRKSCSLLELMRIMRTMPAEPDGGMKTRLNGLKIKLERNRSLLKLHLDAAREIGDLLVGALGEADSDGTYGVPLRRREFAR